MPHLFFQPREVPLSILGTIVPGAVAYFYDAGTSTPRPTFTDATLTVNHPFPVPSNNVGVLPPIWIDPAGGPYKVDIRTAALSNPLSVSLSRYPVDGLQVGPTADEIGRALYDVTPGEQAANITPAKYQYPPGHVWRYGALGDNTFDNATAFQQAMDSGAGVVYVPNGEYLIGKPLLIKPTSTQNLTIVGEGRTNTYLIPKFVDISTAPQNINALIINQADNGKFSIRNIRFQSKIGVPYTGIAIYAKEGGCADGSGQAIFSGSIQDCWFGMASQNGGVFRGGLNNFEVSRNVFEFCKGCFYRDGAGMADVIFNDNQVYFSFDSFYDGMSDTVGDNVVTITNLHVYTHFRGNVINTQNSHSFTTANIKLQAADVPLASVGLFGYKNCRNVLNSGFNAAKETIFGGSGPIGTAITIESCILTKLSDGLIDGPDIGWLLTGSGANNLSFDAVSIYNTLSAAWQLQTGTPNGLVSISRCDWAENQIHGINFANAAGTLEVVLSASRVWNCGLAGSAGARNILVNSASPVRIVNHCAIGKDSGGPAAAGYFFENNGSPAFVDNFDQGGTPPLGLTTGTQPITFTKSVQVITGSVTYDPPSLADGTGSAPANVSVNGAVLGDFVQVSFSADIQGLILQGWVSAANTVSFKFQNETGAGPVDLGSGTISARVLRG